MSDERVTFEEAKKIVAEREQERDRRITVIVRSLDKGKLEELAGNMLIALGVQLREIVFEVARRRQDLYLYRNRPELNLNHYLDRSVKDYQRIKEYTQRYGAWEFLDECDNLEANFQSALERGKTLWAEENDR